MEGMEWVDGGTFRMGSDEFYPEERPAHTTTTGGFWMDRTPVTNAQFARFTGATGYVTVAERTPSPADYPDVDPALLQAGSLVFTAPRRAVDLRDPRGWWRYVAGANWQLPEGPGSDLQGREDHPVVHVAFEDALAYAQWAGKDLPSEREWEFAAKGGCDARYAWGDEFTPGGSYLANTWQGRFPHENLALDGYRGTSPVGSYPANPFGLSDLIGNVWEWCRDDFGPHGEGEGQPNCCTPRSAGDATGSGAEERKVIKGGSHLCAANYCRRYRPAARQGQEVTSSTGHLGFRCVKRP